MRYEAYPVVCTVPQVPAFGLTARLALGLLITVLGARSSSNQRRRDCDRSSNCAFPLIHLDETQSRRWDQDPHHLPQSSQRHTTRSQLVVGLQSARGISLAHPAWACTRRWILGLNMSRAPSAYRERAGRTPNDPRGTWRGWGLVLPAEGSRRSGCRCIECRSGLIGVPLLSVLRDPGLRVAIFGVEPASVRNLTTARALGTRVGQEEHACDCRSYKHRGRLKPLSQCQFLHPESSFSP